MEQALLWGSLVNDNYSLSCGSSKITVKKGLYKSFPGYEDALNGAGWNINQLFVYLPKTGRSTDLYNQLLAVTRMRKLTLASIGVGAVALSFFIGRWWGSASAGDKLLHEEIKRYGKLADLDSRVLQGFPARSNVISSGTYLMEAWFSGTHLQPHEIQRFSARMGKSRFLARTVSIAVVAPGRFQSQGT